MTDKEFDDWTAKYRKRFLGPGENFDFVLTWQQQILPLVFADAIEAIADVAIDARDEARFPRQHLRLIVEYANGRKAARERTQRKPIAWGPRPPAPESWDRKLLELGIIKRKEFDRRQAARKGISA